ncbi:MAG: DUF4270 family protein [Bacteroidales bacterium]|jgi:hypothetical protein|nr:DUF4270 family protein [Bacteroidales bacterium]
MHSLFVKQSSLIIKGLIIIIPFFYSSCSDDKNTIGTDVLEENMLLTVHTDSSTQCVAQTAYDSTIRSKRFAYMVGAYNDPITGSHKAGFINRFYFDSIHYELSDEYTLDSISFVMYDTSYYYGNESAAQTIHIAELQEDLKLSDYTNYNEQGILPSSIIESCTEISTQTYTPQFSKEKGFKYTFSQEYAEELYTRIQSIYQKDTIKSYVDSLLVGVFKGLYVYGDYADAAIIRYASPQIHIYTHSDTAQQTISLLPSPTSYTGDDMTEESVYIESLNIFQHNFSNEVEQSIGSESGLHYIQGHAGLKLELSFDNLDTWKDSSVVINSAQLHLPIQNIDNDEYPYPPILNLRVYNEAQELVLATLSVDFDSSEYVFNFHSFMTDLRNTTKTSSSYYFEIVVPDNNIIGNRVVIDEKDENQIKLVITYTK